MVLCILLGHMQSWAEVLELSVALPGSCPCGERFDDTTVSHKKNLRRSYIRHATKCTHALTHALLKLHEGRAYDSMRQL